MSRPCLPTPGHDPPLIILSCVFALFGVFYAIIGFRCLRAVGFLSGLGAGTGAVFFAAAIRNQPILSGPGDAALAVCCGLLLASVGGTRPMAPLITGALAGTTLGAGGLILYWLAVTGTPVAQNGASGLWSALSVVVGSAVVYAILCIHWTKGLTILSTSIIGVGLILTASDFFLQNFATVFWLWDIKWHEKFSQTTYDNATTTEMTPARLSFDTNNSPYTQNTVTNTNVSDIQNHDITSNDAMFFGSPCWTWILVLLWPPLTIFGMIVQWCVTSRGVRYGGGKQRARGGNINRPRTREARTEMRQKKYRYLYQVRTAHGDVISQSYVAALQRRAHTGGPGESSTLQSDATHLTILPGEPPESDNEASHPHDYRRS